MSEIKRLSGLRPGIGLYVRGVGGGRLESFTDDKLQVRLTGAHNADKNGKLIQVTNDRELAYVTFSLEDEAAWKAKRSLSAS